MCAYAVMSNHYHLVLFINQDVVNSRDQEEVLERWGQLFPSSAHKLQTLLAAADSEVVRSCETRSSPLSTTKKPSS